MAQWVKVLAAKPNYLSSIPRTYMVEGVNQFPQLPSDLHIQAMVPPLPRKNKQTNKCH